MPKYYSKYGKRRFRKTNQATRNKRYIQKSRTARAQQLQLTSLQRQLTITKNKLSDRSQYAQYFCNIEQGEGSDTSQIDLPNGEFYVNNLMRPSSWQDIFQASNITSTTQTNKALIKSFDVQLVFSPKNSIVALTPRIVRVYLVSLRKETAQETLNGTGNMSSAGFNAVANGTYYRNTFVDGGLATMCKLNPAAFRLHAYREFTLANIVEETSVIDENVPITNTRDALKRVRMRLNCGNKLKPPTGTWKQMNENDIMPMDRKYLIVHVGGWANDNDNAVRMDTNITVSCKLTN